MICTHYLGSRGYTIYKENLETKEQVQIRKDLLVKAVVPKTSLAQPTPFPIYRESKTKIYIPRFYGLDNYGIPEKNIISCGEEINVSFSGSLRDYQLKIVSDWLTKTKKYGCGFFRRQQ